MKIKMIAAVIALSAASPAQAQEDDWTLIICPATFVLASAVADARDAGASKEAVMQTIRERQRSAANDFSLALARKLTADVVDDVFTPPYMSPTDEAFYARDKCERANPL